MSISIEQLVASILSALESQSSLRIFLFKRLSKVKGMLLQACCDIKVLQTPVCSLVKFTGAEVNQTLNAIITNESEGSVRDPLESVEHPSGSLSLQFAVRKLDRSLEAH